MKVVPLLEQVITQAEFAEIVGVSEARVSQLVADGVITRGETAAQWLVAYCERLRDQAAGRAGQEAGGLDLVQERAALARSQRVAQDLKNAVACGEFAPVGLLADVLGQAASAVVARFDQLEGQLRKSCTDIDENVLTTVMTILAGARNEWIRSTAQLVAQHVDALAEDAEEEPEPVAPGFGLDDHDVWGTSP